MALAEKMAKDPTHFQIDTLLDVDRPVEKEKLLALGKRTNAVRAIAGDVLFNRDNVAYEVVRHSEADVIALIAAVNVDRKNIPLERRQPLAEAQDVALHDRILSYLNEQSAEGRRRMLIVFNSVLGVLPDFTDPNFLQLLERLGEEDKYGAMKRRQLEMLRRYMPQLVAAGVDPCIVCPGALDTGFAEDALASMGRGNTVMKKISEEFLGRNPVKRKGETPHPKWHQEALINPQDIAQVLTQITIHWRQTGKIPERFREWVILNKEDLLSDAQFLAPPSP